MTTELADDVLASLPQAAHTLAEYPQWIVWKDDDGDKIPINPHSRRTLESASVSDEFTWGRFDEAIDAFRRESDRLEGVGFVFTESDPFIGVDLDDCLTPTTRTIESESAVEIVDRLNTYTEVSPSETGVHQIGLYDGSPVSLRNDGEGIEVYSHRRFFCCTFDPISWAPHELQSVDDQVGWVLETYDSPLSDMESSASSGDGAISIDPDLWVEEALEHIDPDYSYDIWSSVGMALHDGYEGAEEGFRIWDEWSRRGEKYDENKDGQMRRMWRSFRADRAQKRTLRSVWRMAEEAGWSFQSDPEAREAAENLVEQKKQEGPPIQLHSYRETYEDESPYEPNLVEPGLLGCGDMGMLFGPPKSEKTLITVSACRQWAMGREFLWMEPQKSMRIVYLNFELKKDAWRQRSHRLDLSDEELEALDDNFLFTDRMVENLDRDFAMDLVKSVNYYLDEMDLLVVDPTVNFFSGDDENDNQEVMEFIEDLRNTVKAIDEDAASLLVHHTAKVEYEEDVFSNLRGAGAFRGAYDTGWYVNKDKSNGHIEMHTEARNSKEDMPPTEITRDPDTGRYRPVTSREQQREAGESMGDRWDREDARQARQIVETIRTEAEQGRVYTKTGFSRKFARQRDLDIGSARSVRRTIDELEKKRIIMFFDASDYGGPAKRTDSSGHLCVEDMVLPDPFEATLEETAGACQEVRPEWGYKPGYPEPKHISQLDADGFTDLSEVYRHADD